MSTFILDVQHVIVWIKDDGEGFETHPEKAAFKAINIIREGLFLLRPDLKDSFSIKREAPFTIVQFYLPLLQD